MQNKHSEDCEQSVVITENIVIEIQIETAPDWCKGRRNETRVGGYN